MIDLHELYGVELYGAIPLSECVIAKPYLLERAGITSDGSALLILLPYFTHGGEGGNVSMYAAAEDYHAFCRELFSDLCARLSGICPDAKFAGYADHSPIYEVAAAAKAGLGVYGENGLLITREYSSFVFIAGIYTDYPAAIWPKIVSNVELRSTFEAKSCVKCGACRDACPTRAILGGGRIDAEKCLSAITQKKRLTDEDEAAVSAAEYVWGCDICQLACPYTAAARAAGTLETPLSYFKDKLIKTLDGKTLDELEADGGFDRRAFSWRGEAPIRRNINLRGMRAGDGEDHGDEHERDDTDGECEI